MTSSPESVAKALIALAAGLAETMTDEQAKKIVGFLSEYADDPRWGAETCELIWFLIGVLQSPKDTLRGILGDKFA